VFARELVSQLAILSVVPRVGAFRKLQVAKILLVFIGHAIWDAIHVDHLCVRPTEDDGLSDHSP
jgi:hypothetical protein